MNLKTKYEEKRNEEKNGIELYFESIPSPEEREELKNNGFKWSKYNKCWYKSLTYAKTDKQENKQLENIVKLNAEEVQKVAESLYNSERMQKYIIETYDFYKTKDGLLLEFEKINKISITKELYYDDETEAPDITEKNFIIYNSYNTPGKNLEEYIKEKKNLQENGCASGRYDYNGIYFEEHYYNNKDVVSCNWYEDKDNRTFKRYLSIEEEKDFITLMEERKEQYIDRLKKYFKRYGNKVRAHGYWANR